MFGLGTVPLSTSIPSAAQSHGDCDGDTASSPATTTTHPLSPAAARSKGCSDLGSPIRRKNKRKLSEPKKRGADLGVKRHCQSSPGGSAMSESCCSDDGGEDNSAVQQMRPGLSQDREDSSSRAPSEVDDAPVLGSSDGLTHNAPSLPLFPLGLSSGACFLPGFYLAADAGAGLLPQPFPPLSICLPQPGHASVTELRGRNRDTVHLDYYGQVLQTQTPPHQTESPKTEDLSGEEEITNCTIGGRQPRKNYKNMTKERRVEANARERTRVHTISAAFEALRHAVPSYSYNQKLSKLAILKIASSYIMALARLADVDCSHVSEPSIPITFADCVDLCTRTIQSEGRARRKH